MKKFLTTASVLFTLFFVGGCVLFVSSMAYFFGEKPVHVHKGSVLVLDLEGVILDSRTFVDDLVEYRDNPKIKAVVVRINSPGGAVGPSQEMYSELKKVREVFKKPVVISCSSLAASGGYYVAVAGDQIVTNPGTLMGSIGVIMQFANLEDLYKWAKIQPYVIKTGPYKDSGAEFRAMRDDEKKLFQELIDGVHMQFKKAVAEGRKLPLEKVEPYADGRILTGEQAVKLGLADKLGTFEDAVKLAGQLSGLGDNPEIFEPPKRHEHWTDYLEEISEGAQGKMDWLKPLSNRVLKTQLWNQPLYMMPGFWGE